jgi:Family of unknown function (DUF6065)
MPNIGKTSEDTREASMLRIAAFPISGMQWMEIVPAPAERLWIKPDNESLSSDCVRITNQLGWMVLNNRDVEVVWNGGSKKSDLRIYPEALQDLLESVHHSGNGILTWKLPFFLEIPPNIHLRIRGPVNSYKDGAFPLECIYGPPVCKELSISWKITRIGLPITFQAGEPLCMLWPESLALIKDAKPTIESDKREIHPERLLTSNESHDAKNSDLRETAGRDGIQTPAFQDLRSPLELSQSSDSGFPTVIHARAERSIGRERGSSYATEPRSSLPYRIEDSFYEQADLLRAQIEKALSGSVADPANHLLNFHYMAGVSQYIIASADDLFTKGLLVNFLDRIRAWARQFLAVSHASTPQVSIYTSGCSRALVRDDINARWHYMFSLTRNPKRRVGRIRIASEMLLNEKVEFSYTVGRVSDLKLTFNQFLVHEVDKPYGIDGTKNPGSLLDGAILADGYLW